jgi:hypothetical protein
LCEYRWNASAVQCRRCSFLLEKMVVDKKDDLQYPRT